ncbi:MAG: NAD(P)H-dependent oxidoreductase [Bacteroidia bacterium]
MQKILIIHAHPEPNSFCSSLKNTAKTWFEFNGAEVRVVDLYQNNFSPVGGKNDFVSTQNPNYFKYQQEQLSACESGSFIDEINAEMANFEWCDTLIFNFPLWWFGLPAILKGWVDRVFAMGFAYGGGKGIYDNGVFQGKKAFLTFTTGGPEIAYGNTGKNGDLDTILYPIQHGMFYFVGMTVLPPFISFSPVRKSSEELMLELKRYETYLTNLEHLTPIFSPVKA